MHDRVLKDPWSLVISGMYSVLHDLLHNQLMLHDLLDDITRARSDLAACKRQIW